MNALVDEFDPNAPDQSCIAQLTDPAVLVAALCIEGATRRSRSYLTIPCPKGCGGKFCTLGWVKKKGAILWFCPTCRGAGNALHLIALAKRWDVVRDFRRVLAEGWSIAARMRAPRSA